ncbi:MAG: DUF4332 domain-containing protein [Anaerolineae bacterium]|nr:DUF4332 domain-containing protein [Anaerolineae bacterium]
MTIAITEIKGMSTETADKLKAKNIKDSAGLLAAAGKAADRRLLAKELGIEAAQLLEYVNRADLVRIKGVGAQYSNLLEDAGVDSVKELAHRKPENLHVKLTEAAASSGIKRVPRLDEVQAWVAEAKTMEAAVTH